MKIMFKELPCIKVEGERYHLEPHKVVEEVPVPITVNGRSLATVMLSPVMLEEFVTGFLFTEQIINEPSEIESIRVEGNKVSVLTNNPFKVIMPRRTVLSGCGGSSSFLDAKKLPKIESDLKINLNDVRNGVNEVLASEMHRMTGGVHVVGLMKYGTLITLSEDIGRHNALDRVIGYGLTHSVDFPRTFVISSGRISSEMVRKCLTANIPIIVSRGASTTLAIEIAEKTGITIIGFARGEKMNIYSGADRIEGIKLSMSQQGASL